jgi:hypothetical protein
MKKLAGWLSIAAVFALLAGCGSTRNSSNPPVAGHTQMPTLRAQGTAEQQQHAAQRYDPYPDNNIAPNIAAGGRPPGYLHELPETERSLPTPRRMGSEPMIGSPVGPPAGPVIQPPNGAAPVGSP